MSPSEPMAEAMGAELDPYARKLRKRLREARRGDAEGVHDARTTLRRLREGLVVLGRTVVDPERTSRLERKLHRLEQALAATRDDDVLAADLESWLRHAPRDARNALSSLHAHVRDLRREHARALAKELRRCRHARALRRLRRLLAEQGGGLAATGPRNPAKAAPCLVRHFVADVTWRAYEEVLAYEMRQPADVDVIHKVRSSCRRLRYELELFEGALPPGAADLVGALRALQDRLGDLHDHAVAVARVEAWVERGDVRASDALRRYLRHRAAERDRLRAEFDDEWRRLTGDAFRYTLSHVLSGEIGRTRPDGAVRLTAA